MAINTEHAEEYTKKLVLPKNLDQDY